jgi:cytochrome c553
MWGPSRALTNQQIDQIATYFAAQPPMRASAGGAEVPERGKVIFHQGLPAAGVEPCANCHGVAAEGDDTVPRLAGQHAYYLESRARIAMTNIVAPLSDRDIADVAAYLQSIGAGGAAPSRLVPTAAKVVDLPAADPPPTPRPFDAQGDAKNCHYSVWTYGWYCGSFLDALIYHLKHQ